MAYDQVKRAKLRCMHLLEKRDYTEKQLRDKLRMGKTAYTEEEIEAAIAYVKSYHYVDDGRYARQYISCMSARKSKRQIMQELYQRGVEKELVDAAFEEADDIQEEQQIAEWIRKRHYDPAVADQKEKQKMYAFLMRKGFQSSEISRALKTEFSD